MFVIGGVEVFFSFIFPITIIYSAVIQFAGLFHLVVGFRGRGSFTPNKWNLADSFTHIRATIKRAREHDDT